MKSRTARAKVTARPASRFSPAPLELAWAHFGVTYRVTVWPEVALERLNGERWEPIAVGEGIIASGSVQLDTAAWRRYLDYVPAAERTFLERFRFGRLAALLMVARCPSLLVDLDETPALVPFLAAHAELRGTEALRWDELAVVHERGGIFAVLEWLGLPASRQTLAILRNLVDPDVPRSLLEPLRALLWRPEATFILQRSSALTDQQLARYCHALAA
ncbi:MAG: hypothetical protein ABW223_06620 [Rariglobus sp.]